MFLFYKGENVAIDKFKNSKGKISASRALR